MNVKMLVRTAGALVFCSLLFGVSGCQTREPLLYVNGTAVTEEEMALLNDDADTAVRMKVLQKTAEEYGVIDAFSLEELKSDLEQENQRRHSSCRMEKWSTGFKSTLWFSITTL